MLSVSGHHRHIAQVKRKPRGIRHDRDCGTCKSRGVKCDLNRPSCNTCQVIGTICAGYKSRVVWMNERKGNKPSTRTRVTRQDAQDYAPERPTSASGSGGSSARSTDHARFDGSADIRWPTASLTTASLFDDSSGITTLKRFLERMNERFPNSQTAFDALAHQSTAEASQNAQTLIARVSEYAWAHLRFHKEKNNSSQMLALHSNVVALVDMLKAIDEGRLVAIFGIAIFAFLDVCEAPFGQWDRHLQGARSLLDMHCTNGDELDGLFREVRGLKDTVAQLAWFDVMGCAISGRGRLIFEDWHRTTLDESFFSLTGCSLGTFNLFVVLAKSLHTENSSNLWVQAMDQYFQQPDASDDLDDFEHTQIAWRCVGLMASVAATEEARTESGQRVIQSLIDKICSHIKSVPLHSIYHVHLGAIVYIASRHARCAEHQEVIREYWRNCQKLTLPHYADALEQCETWWRANGWT